MTTLIVFLGMILVILSYLLLAPFYFEVNSIIGLYRIRFHRLASVRIYSTSESVYLEFRITRWHKAIDLFKSEPRPVRNTRKPLDISRKRKTGMDIRKVQAVITSFKISKCLITLDTGDMALNGILYPWFLWIGELMSKDISINFCNRNEIVLEIENNFFRVLRAYIYFEK